MSVIAVKVTQDKIEIASDSMISKDEFKRNDFKKFINITPNHIVGGCGNVDELCLFFEYAKTKEAPQPTVIGILNFMKNFLRYKSDYLNENEITNQYVIVTFGKAFIVEGMFVQEIKDYYAIGSAEAYASTALYLGFSAEEAVKVSCDLSCHVCPPVRHYVVDKK